MDVDEGRVLVGFAPDWTKTGPPPMCELRSGQPKHVPGLCGMFAEYSVSAGDEPVHVCTSHLATEVTIQITEPVSTDMTSDRT